MAIVEMVISELNSLGYLNRGFVCNEEIELNKKKYFKYQEELIDEVFLSGFHEGYRSPTGIPNEIIKISKNSNKII